MALKTRNQKTLNNKTLLTNKDWDRIYKEKFEDPYYYDNFYRSSLTLQSSLNAPKTMAEVGTIHDIQFNPDRRSPKLGYILRGLSKISY